MSSLKGSGRRRIVEDDRDRRAYMTRYERIRRDLGWLEYTGCLMDTHHHAILETREPNLGIGMQRLQGGHARWFNARHGREGHVFRHRYWSRRIEDDAWLFRACICVIVNPVVAGLCSHPREWRWCSFAVTANGDPDSFDPGEERLLGMFGRTPREAREAYVEVVDEAAPLACTRRSLGWIGVWRAIGELVPPERRVHG